MSYEEHYSNFDEENYDPDVLEADEDEIERAICKIKQAGGIPSGSCMVCDEPNGMKNDGCGFFVCSKCRYIIDEDFYYRWAAGYPASILDDRGQILRHPSYEEIYDADGEYVEMHCNNCIGVHVKWRDDTGYVCPNCGDVKNRAEVFDYAGIEPLGAECLICDNLYPGCMSCSHGYVDEDNI
jgi:hypothetical protein